MRMEQSGQHLTPAIQGCLNMLHGGRKLRSLLRESFVDPRDQELAANSLLDTSDGQVFIACFRRAGLDRTADIKPVFPDARLNRFEGVFYPFVIHGTDCPFAAMRDHHPVYGGDKLRWPEWLGQKNAVRNTLRGPLVGVCCGDVEDGKAWVDLSRPLRNLPSSLPKRVMSITSA